MQLEDIIPFLKTLRAHPSMNSSDIDDNWEAIVASFTQIVQVLQQGNVTFTGATTDANGDMLLQLSNGATLGPVSLNKAVIAPLGPHQVGVSYKIGDIVEKSGSSYMARVPHVAEAFEDDLAADRWMTIAGGVDTQAVDDLTALVGGYETRIGDLETAGQQMSQAFQSAEQTLIDYGNNLADHGQRISDLETAAPGGGSGVTYLTCYIEAPSDTEMHRFVIPVAGTILGDAVASVEPSAGNFIIEVNWHDYVASNNDIVYAFGFNDSEGPMPRTRSSATNQAVSAGDVITIDGMTISGTEPTKLAISIPFVPAA